MPSVWSCSDSHSLSHRAVNAGAKAKFGFTKHSGSYLIFFVKQPPTKPEGEWGGKGFRNHFIQIYDSKLQTNIIWITLTWLGLWCINLSLMMKKYMKKYMMKNKTNKQTPTRKQTKKWKPDKTKQQQKNTTRRIQYSKTIWFHLCLGTEKLPLPPVDARACCLIFVPEIWSYVLKDVKIHFSFVSRNMLLG